MMLLRIPFMQAQTIPDSVTTDWTYAGLSGSYLDTSNVADVTTFGATGNGTTNDFPAISAAIASLSGNSGIVFFPAGTYLINSTLNLPDSVTLRGAGSDVTTMLFNLNGVTGNCINIQKTQVASYMTIDSGYSRGSNTVVVDSGSAFTAGDYAEIRQQNGSWDTNPVFWADNSVGQIVRIDSVSGDTLYFQHPLRFEYDSALHVEIRPIVPRTNVGLECFKMVREDSTAASVNYGIFYWFAADCHIRGVESDHSIGAHVWAEASTSLEISGSYFHHSYIYDGSNTKGYGVVMAVHTGECKIENNIFRHLRHSMMVKQGANGNVFGYNYSIEPTRTEFPADAGADVSLHGHYPFANLFEGNIVQNVGIDQTWGPSGPFNTFFRNRIELYGIVESPGTINTELQNFAGNDITGTGPFQGNYILTGVNFEWGNRVKGVMTPAATDTLPDSTYYLGFYPAFWNITPSWPSIGTQYTLSGQTIPARERYLAGTGLTICTPFPPVFASIHDNENGIRSIAVSPTIFSDELTVTINANNADKYLAIMTDASGKLIYQQEQALASPAGNIKISSAGIRPGFYLLIIKSSSDQKAFRCIKMQ